MEPHTTDNLPSHHEIESLCSDNLKGLYEKLLHTRPPPRTSIDFLRGNISWALQALALDETPMVLREKLITRTNGKTPSNKTSVIPGTHLIREWQGKTHQVTVLEHGYLWQEQHYKSLSRIAKEITGAHWSGPRFFGLKASS